MFGMCSSAVSEILWEVSEAFIDSKGQLLGAFGTDLMRERAQLYEQAIQNKRHHWIPVQDL